MMDHVQQIQSRTYAQYRDKAKLVAWLKINGHLANQFESAAQDVSASYDIDNADTLQLDIIGRIVGVGRAYGNPAESLSNDVYRLVIRSKIWKNHSDATIDSILLGVQFITGIKDMRLIDNENMTFSIEFYEQLTDIQRDALTNYDIVPRPQGVQFSGFEEVENTDNFGGFGVQFGRWQFARYLGG